MVSAFETYRRLVLIQSLRLITTSTWYGRIRKSRRTSNLILRALAKKNTAMHRHVPAVSHVPESAEFKIRFYDITVVLIIFQNQTRGPALSICGPALGRCILMRVATSSST